MAPDNGPPHGYSRVLLVAVVTARCLRSRSSTPEILLLSADSRHCQLPLAARLFHWSFQSSHRSGRNDLSEGISAQLGLKRWQLGDSGLLA